MATDTAPIHQQRLLRASELAELLGVSKRKAFTLLGHQIPVVTLGRRCRRVRLADVLAFIDARRESPESEQGRRR